MNDSIESTHPYSPDADSTLNKYMKETPSTETWIAIFGIFNIKKILNHPPPETLIDHLYQFIPKKMK
jgi:hypothetical protein